MEESICRIELEIEDKTFIAKVQTDMGGPGAEITAEESASGIRNVISGLTKEDSGNFYKWNGEIHPW